MLAISRRQTLKVSLAATLALMLRAEHADAQVAVACVNCATTYTQLLQYGKEAESVVNQVRSYALQLQQYSNMVQNTVAMPMQTWMMVQGTISRVQQLSNVSAFLGGQGASLMTRLNGMSAYGSMAGSMTNVVNQYQSWGQMAGSQLNQTLSTLGYHQSQNSTDADLLAQMQRDASTADGQMRALQAGNQLAQFSASQSLKTQELLQTGIQLTAARMAIDADRQALQDQGTLGFNAPLAIPTTGYQRF